MGSLLLLFPLPLAGAVLLAAAPGAVAFPAAGGAAGAAAGGAPGGPPPAAWGGAGTKLEDGVRWCIGMVIRVTYPALVSLMELVVPPAMAVPSTDFFVP